MELLGDLSLEEKLDLAVWADENGFDDAWLAEISDPDAFVTLAVAATRTERIRVGTAIIPMGPRSVPMLASSATTVHEISNGRFVLGLGVSTKVIVEKWNGAERGRPLGRTRETVDVLRTLFAGDRTDYEGEFVRTRGFKLRHPPETPPAIALAAMNVKMLELAGEIADAVLLNFLPVDAVSKAIEAVGRGAERAGRDSLPELIMMVPMEVTDDVDRARRAFADDLAFYLSAPPYQKALTWYGLGDHVERAKEAWATGDIERVRAGIADELVDAIGAFGSPEHCRQRLEDYWNAGIGTLAITAPVENARETLKHFAR